MSVSKLCGAILAASTCACGVFDKMAFESTGDYSVRVSDTQTASVVITDVGVTLRLFDHDVGGTTQTGWISAVRDRVDAQAGVAATGEEIYTGRVVAAQGFFADDANLCRRLWIRANSQRFCGALSDAEEVEPADCDAALTFNPGTALIDEQRAHYRAKKVGAVDIWVEDGCAGGAP